MDLHTHRPLELRIRRMEKDNSIHAADRLGRVACDALVQLVILYDEPVEFKLMTVEGHSGESLGDTAMFHVWLALTDHLASKEAEPGNADDAKQKAFLGKIRGLLRMDAAAEEGAGGEEETAGARGSSLLSTLVSTPDPTGPAPAPQPEDPSATSTG